MDRCASVRPLPFREAGDQRYTPGSREIRQRYRKDTNNGVERALRASCIGRKSWLFAGSDDGARRAAILYTVISTAVLCDVEPWAYVRDLLEKVSSGFPQRRIDELLPEAWRTLHPQARLRRDSAAASTA